VWLALRFGGDRWWLATVILFGPRWFCALPLAILGPAAAIWRRALLRPLAAAAIVVLWPIMGLCLPWARILPAQGPALRVLTCNTDGRADAQALLRMVQSETPDVVALQECRGGVEYQWPAGWNVLRHGELLVASRYPLREIRYVSGRRLGHVWPRSNLLQCTLALPGREVAFCCVHLPSPRYGLAGVLDRKTLLSPGRAGLIAEQEGERLQQAEAAAQLARDISMPLVLAGDFNMPTDSTIYRKSWAAFRNAFSWSGFGFGHTMRPAIRGWRYGIRIDHILAGRDWRPRRCWVGPDVGSEHLPLVADLVLDDSAT